MPIPGIEKLKPKSLVIHLNNLNNNITYISIDNEAIFDKFKNIIGELFYEFATKNPIKITKEQKEILDYISKSKKEDDSILLLRDKLSYKKFMQKISDNIFLLLMYESSIVGYVTLKELSNATIFLSEIFISSKYRNKGIGQILYKNIEEAAKLINIKYITLFIMPQNEHSQYIAEKMGYVHISDTYSKLVK
jgi:ribosomal protein S18 acetylase RimI-like enzyme